jgi:CO/xanthine dehydrogenase FAD-binding subunit
MKPPPFAYVAARSLDEAVRLLAEGGPDAKVLAGGQSLVPMLNFRLLEPSLLVDINRIAALDFIEADDRRVRIGALTRHRAVETSPVIADKLPILAATMRHVAHFAIRNRGTFGGSLAHADPAAELPLLALLLDAEIAVASARGERSIAAKAFFIDALTTVLEPGEILFDVVLPSLPSGTGWHFEELSRRAGDFALVAVGVTVRVRDGRCAEARIALGGVGPTPVRAAAAEAMLRGAKIDLAAIAAAAAAARDGIAPQSDLHASADYRRHLAEVLVRRALQQASTA